MKKLFLMPVLFLGLSFSACQKETVSPEPQAEANVTTKGLTPIKRLTFSPSEVHLYRHNGPTSAIMTVVNEDGTPGFLHMPDSRFTIMSFTGPVEDPKTLLKVQSGGNGRVIVSLKDVPYMYEQPTKAAIYFQDGEVEALGYVTVHMVKQLEPPLDPLY